ncbi:hypothetical protein [Vibrio mangrovi]|uniref:Uncharacterized protein n=1 Tax=Vibrio mangrovi TaxID=474394 RepID=A0A1Y6ISA9_9VIBR|nr:hypothetical protein [Vibrio mangrovi]MDW6003290.1 hypothetical protein [Vibrio mangrovi]SMR99921.1 hypothetical protein VIM7927_01159 [Vibrio mangrovi]
MKKTLVLMIGCLASLNLYATTNPGSGQKWYGPFTLTKVARYWDGSYHRMSVHIAEEPGTDCSVTNSEKKISYVGRSETFSDSLFSAAATAQAQNKRVMLLLDGACDASFGKNVHGIEIFSD